MSFASAEYEKETLTSGDLMSKRRLIVRILALMSIAVASLATPKNAAATNIYYICMGDIFRCPTQTEANQSCQMAFGIDEDEDPADWCIHPTSELNYCDWYSYQLNCAY
jgi:hypothetical protein